MDIINTSVLMHTYVVFFVTVNMLMNVEYVYDTLSMCVWEKFRRPRLRQGFCKSP